MRTLRFIVDGLIITKDPSCNFEGLIPGTDGYLQAEFSFSPEWNNCAKVVSFNYRDKEFPPRILTDGKTCEIPTEALASRAFYVRILGKGENLKLTTNSVAVVQDGGNV